MIYIFWTCRDRAEAREVIRGLLEKRLAACATLIPNVESMYLWKGRVEEGVEVKVILKTKKALFEDARDYILKNSSYEIPEICEVEVGRANPLYLQWILEETAKN